MDEFIKQIKVAAEMLAKEYDVKDIYINIEEATLADKEITVQVEI